MNECDIIIKKLLLGDKMSFSEIIFKNICSQYKNNYDKILKIIYPAKKYMGFTERNLTVNFSKAYDKVYSNDEIATWFEFTFGNDSKKDDLHLDCIIINKTQKNIFLIEAKRFRNIRKLRSTGWDIRRLFEVYDNREAEFNKRLIDINDYSFYGIILADIWVKPKQRDKKVIMDEFENKKLFSKSASFFSDIYEKYASDSFTAQQACDRLNNGMPLYNLQQVDTNDMFSNYKLNLLTLCWQINDCSDFK